MRARAAALLARVWPWQATARAALSDSECGAALLDASGSVLSGRGLLCPVGSALDHVPPRAASRLRAALHAGVPYAADAEWDGRPVRLRFSPGPLAGGGTLLLRDRSREAALEDALSQAQRLQEVGELAGGIAHDFNNLLTAVLGAAEDLRGGNLNREQLAEIEQIEASARRGAEMVRQLLAFSRRQTLQPRPFILDDAVRGTAALLQRLLGKSVRLELQLDAPGRLVLMDPTQLDQLLMNLAVNGRNAMGEAGGTITIATGFRLILDGDGPRVGGAGEPPPAGRYVRLTVSDTGRGIPAEILPRIFDPFFTTRRGEGGTGLGLAMVMGIVRQSGGYLGVRSTPGAGTVFDITLPRYEGALPAPAVAPVRVSDSQRAAQPAPEGAILLVDDEAAVRRLAARALGRAGWSVIEAADAEEALEHDAGALRCVVSDVVMPGLDGPGLVRALRARHPGLPAILVSGYAQEEQRRALASEDVLFLPKPFSLAALTETVATAMNSVSSAA